MFEEMQMNLQRPPNWLWWVPLKRYQIFVRWRPPKAIECIPSAFTLFEISSGWRLPHFEVCFPKMHMQMLRVTNPEAITVRLLSSPTALINLWALSSFSGKLILHCLHFRVSCLESPPLSSPMIPTSYSLGSFFCTSVGGAVDWGKSEATAGRSEGKLAST